MAARNRDKTESTAPAEEVSADLQPGAVVVIPDGEPVHYGSVEEARADFPRGWVLTAEEYADYQASQADESEQADGEG